MSKKNVSGQQDEKCSFAEMAARQLLIEGRWRWLIYILLFELWLAYSIPPTILSDVPLLKGLVDTMQLVISGLGYVTPERTLLPEAARLYLSVTFLLVIPKVLFFFYWLNSDRKGIYRHLVISPLTDQSPVNPGEFIIEPMQDGDKQPRQQKSRSMFSRILWSSLILALSLGVLWLILDPFTSNDKTLYRSFMAGGYLMWFGWAVKFLTLASFYFAVCLCIGRDYYVFFSRTISNISNGSKP